MKNSIFREKSLDRISAPEHIDDYMRVTSPSMWLILGAIILLLVAAVIWSITGRIETTVTAEGQVQDQSATVELSAAEAEGLTVGSEARIGDMIGAVTEVIPETDNVLVVAAIPEAPDGSAEITLVTECIAPITFLTE
jgi:hypothetical protein